MRRLPLSIAELRAEPARERLAIIVINDALQRRYDAGEPDSMAVPLVLVASLARAIEHSARRIECAAERPTENAIDEPRAITHLPVVRRQTAELTHQIFAELIVGIHRQDPLRRHEREAEVALLGKTVEGSMADFYARVPRQDV